MSSVADSLRQASARSGRIPERIFLPPKNTLFVGRETKIAEIWSALSQKGGGKRIVVHGQGGVGKSALALEIASAEASRPSYELVAWIDCDRIKFNRDRFVKAIAAPADISDIARELARVAGSEAAQRAIGPEALRALRARLSELRALIVIDGLDGLYDPEAEAFLLSLPSSVDLIVTTRMNLRWPISIHVLPWMPPTCSDARSQLESLLQQTQSTLTEHEVNVVLCASRGIPLAISWCAALIWRGVSVQKLTDIASHDWADLLAHIYEPEWIANFVSMERRKAAAILAMAGSVSCDTLNAILTADQPMKQSSVRLALLEANFAVIANNQVESLPFAREFILNKIEKETVMLRAVTASWLDNLIARTRAAQKNSTWGEAFKQIDIFRGELVLALKWASTLWKNPPNNFLDLTELTAYYFYSRGFWDEFLQWELVGLRTAHARRRSRYIVEVALVWGVRIRRHRDGSDAAATYFRTWDKNLDKHPAEPVLDRICAVAETSLRDSSQTNVQLANDLERLATELLEIGETEWACRAILHAGNVWSELGDLPRAGAAFTWLGEEAILANKPPCPWASEMIALSVGSQGIIANRAGRFNTAVSLLSKGIEGLTQTYDLAIAYGEHALALTESGSVEKARDAFEYCLELKRRLGILKSVMESRPNWDLAEASSSLPISQNQQKGLLRFLRWWR